MSISAKCPQCGKTYFLNESMAGKTVRCRLCGTGIAVPAAVGGAVPNRAARAIAVATISATEQEALSRPSATGADDVPMADVAAPMPVSANPASSPGVLGYAPPARGGNRTLFVLIAGLATSAIALAGQYLLNRQAQVNVMGWYLDYIFPVGAILLGLVASSGYAITSLKLGVRIRRGLLALIVLLMFSAYFAAEYIEYRVLVPVYPVQVQVPKSVKATRGSVVRFSLDGQNYMLVTNRAGQQIIYQYLGFWQHYHLRAVNWTWKPLNDSGAKGDPLGMAGYFFVGLGVLGFTLSGLIFPVAISRRPYCELCQRYMKTRQLLLLPGSLPVRKFKKSEVEEKARFIQTHADTWRGTLHRTEALFECVKGGDVAGFIALRDQSTPPAKEVNKLPRRLEIKASKCESCFSGILESTEIAGQGKQIKRSKLSKVDVSPDFNRGLSDAAKV